MFNMIRPEEQQRSPRGTVTFEGEPHGSDVSMFLVHNEPGEGPDLHRHPYSETWLVRTGNVRMTADGVDIDAGPGDIVVVTPLTPHKFKNLGPGKLDIICIHASPRMIQESLED